MIDGGGKGNGKCEIENICIINVVGVGFEFHILLTFLNEYSKEFWIFELNRNATHTYIWAAVETRVE